MIVKKQLLTEVKMRGKRFFPVSIKNIQPSLDSTQKSLQTQSFANRICLELISK